MIRFASNGKVQEKNPSRRWDSVSSLSFHLIQQRIMFSYVLLVKKLSVSYVKFSVATICNLKYCTESYLTITPCNRLRSS